MSTYLLPEAIHVAAGREGLDFPAGEVAAKSYDEERALDIAVRAGKAEQTTRSAPPVPASVPAGPPPAPAGAVAPPTAPPDAGAFVAVQAPPPGVIPPASPPTA